MRHISLKKKIHATVMRGLSRNTQLFIVVVLVACLILIFLNVLELRNFTGRATDTKKRNIQEPHQPVYAIFTKDGQSSHLVHVHNLMNRLGYVEGKEHTADWDVLWSHPYPFTIMPGLKSLKPHQKVNHFPGSGFITNKANLATIDIHHVPKAFRLPQDRQKLLDHVKRNPKKVFVQKSNNHRGIRILKVQELDLTANGTFVQEYIDRPLLIDGYKFDIGVYTTLTSVDPLRVYIYNGDVLFRFCPEQYHPFDPKNVNKYVIGDDYLPTWKIPSLKKYFTAGGFSMKDSFDAYMREIGKEPETVWRSVRSAIQEVYLQTEPAINKLLSQYKTKTTFFEMVRFDFVIDEDLNVFIMEANMSPNLSSKHFPPNAILYEQVLFSVLSLVGIGQHVHTGSLMRFVYDSPINCIEFRFFNDVLFNSQLFRTAAQIEMQVNSKQLGVYPEICAGKCDNTCMAPECQLCQHCLTEENRSMLREAYLEHVNRHECRRVFPPPMVEEQREQS